MSIFRRFEIVEHSPAYLFEKTSIFSPPTRTLSRNPHFPSFPIVEEEIYLPIPPISFVDDFDTITDLIQIHETPFHTSTHRVTRRAALGAELYLQELSDRVAALELGFDGMVKGEKTKKRIGASKYTWKAEIRSPEKDRKYKWMTEIKDDGKKGLEKSYKWTAEIKGKEGEYSPVELTYTINVSGGDKAGEEKKKCEKSKVKAKSVKPAGRAVEIEEPSDHGAIVLRQVFAKRVEKSRGKRKQLSPQDAAALIQMSFRAYLIRRSQALRALRELAIAKNKLKELRALFNNFSYRRRISHDAEERQRFSEKVIVLLLTVDAIEGTFLPLVVPPTAFQTGFWSTWLAVLCFLKMFQALARDRLERLNASPSATPWSYFRAYSALLFVFSVDLLWILLCLTVQSVTRSSLYLLLFFEPSSIAFETLQAIVVHGFQLLEIWLQDSSVVSTKWRLSKIFDVSPAGSLEEWKGILIRNLGFFLDMMTLLMALAHYLHIWWLHGMAFHLVDVVLLMNIRALLSAIMKRIKGFIKLRIALGTLHGALPDATCDELRAYDDECAICREPMAKAKKLSCNHLFHLACLRSWLDQGLSESYSCPTCRKPLFSGRPENVVNPSAAEISRDDQLARQMSAGFERPNISNNNLHPEVFSNQSQNVEPGDWRTGVDSTWLSLDGAGPSGLSRVQMVMRQLAAVGETYAQTALEDAAWSLFPPNSSQSGTSTSAIPAPSSMHYPRSASGLRLRSTTQSTGDNLANIIAMAETVREVLPHIPEHIIFQDLQRTNSATLTVNNLLQM